MKTKRLFTIFSSLLILTAMIMLTFSGCASSGSDQTYGPQDSGMADYDGYEKSTVPEDSSGGADTAGDTDSIRKLIKNASVMMEAENVDETFTAIGDWVYANDGYEFSRNVNTDDDIKHINAVYKLPPDKLIAFLVFMRETYTVVNEYISSEDITDQYYDAKIRLDNLMEGREELLRIQEQSKNIEDILRVQSELRMITGEIETIEGRLKLWDRLVAESTVSITIIQANDPMKHSREISFRFSSLDDVWKTMKNGFVIVTNTLLNIVTWLLIIIVSVAPLGVIALVVLLIVRHFMRKNRKQGKGSGTGNIGSTGNSNISGTGTGSNGDSAT